MNEDKFLKDLLADYHPQLSDDNTFMQRLQRQMELIEEVKAYQRAESRKNKLMSLKLLVVGVVLGCSVKLASVTIQPKTTPTASSLSDISLFFRLSAR